jgi:hypothetical protein
MEQNSDYGTGCFSILAETLAFPWIPVRRTLDSSVEYLTIGASGTVTRTVSLVILNGVAALLGLMVLFFNNPYVPISNDLHYFPFDLAFVFLTLVSFLGQIAVHFVCFRVVSGKGNLVAHAYLSALSSASYVLLLCIAIIVLYVTRINGIDNFVVIAGGLYLLYPSLVSLRAIHKLSVGRTIIGFALSIVGSIPLIILHLRVFAFLRESWPYEVYDWRSMIIFGSMLFVSFFILTYMLEQERLINRYDEGIPIPAPLRTMLKTRWVQVSLVSLIVCLPVFYLLDIQYPSLNPEDVPYEIQAHREVWNPIRGESYRLTRPVWPGGYERLTITRSDDEQEMLEIDELIGAPNPVHTIEVHPNGEYIYLVSDGYVAILDVDPLQLVDIIRLGGKLRGVALDPDGNILYVLDKLWNRLRVVPLPES